MKCLFNKRLPNISIWTSFFNIVIFLSNFWTNFSVEVFGQIFVFKIFSPNFCFIFFKKEFVFSIITRNDCVITGDPGDGKSTLLAKITEASCFVKLTPEHVSEIFQTQNLAESCELVPIMIRLSDLVQKGRQGITIKDSPDEIFLAKLETFYSHIEGNEIISKTIRNGIKNNSKDGCS